MSDNRTAWAIDRIEAALRRIEAASGRNPRSGSPAAEFSHLATRHDALREEVRGALQALDALTGQGA